jgi:hypothetical protein
MTDLRKPVCRRSRFPFMHYRRKIVVVLELEDILAMRLERSRFTYRATFADVFRQLIEWHILRDRDRKREGRKKRRTA